MAPILYPVKRQISNNDIKYYHWILKQDFMNSFVNFLFLTHTKKMHLGRSGVRFSNGPISTDKHISIYIHTWLELKEPQSTMSSSYGFENGVLEISGNTSEATGLSPTREWGLRCPVLCPSATSQTFCTHAPVSARTHAHIGMEVWRVLACTTRPGATAPRGTNPRRWIRIPAPVSYSAHSGQPTDFRFFL